MGELVPRKQYDVVEVETLAGRIRSVASRGLTVISDSKLVRPILFVLRTIADYLAANSDRYRYVRRSRKTFKMIIAALEQGDHSARLCASYCKRYHAFLPPQDRALFVEGFIACYQIDAHWIIGVFAQCEQQEAQQFAAFFVR